MQHFCLFFSFNLSTSWKYHVHDRTRFTYDRQSAFVHYSEQIYTKQFIGSHLAVACRGTTRLNCKFSSLQCWNRLLVRDTCSQTWKFFREARGPLSSSLISNQVHRGPMNNPSDISPTLNRRTSARMDVVTHRSAVLSCYFVIIFSARLPLEFGLRARDQRIYKSKFGDSSIFCTLTMCGLYARFKAIVWKFNNNRKYNNNSICSINLYWNN